MWFTYISQYIGIYEQLLLYFETALKLEFPQKHEIYPDQYDELSSNQKIFLFLLP